MKRYPLTKSEVYAQATRQRHSGYWELFTTESGGILASTKAGLWDTYKSMCDYRS